MKSIHSRLICRAHNRFSPSLFLWQHFGVLEQPRPFPHRPRLASTATNAPPGERVEQPDDASSLEAGNPAPLIPVDVPKNDGESAAHPVRIHKPKTSQGSVMQRDKKSVSIRKFKARELESQAISRSAPKQLLLHGTSGDYAGVVVEPMNANGSLKTLHRPWIVEDMAGISGIQRLNLEIERFFQYTSPNEHELIARQSVAERVREEVRKALPHRALEVFGSERTGLALSTSDIDFRLLPEEQLSETLPVEVPPRYGERKQNIRDLESLRRNLFRSSTAILPMLRYARYPLVGYQDRDTGLDVQIVASNNTSLSREIMNDYMKQYPYLRQVYLVVKTMLDVRGLTDVFRGGFGSYPLFMMIVASIKHQPHRRNDAAGSLINFLHFYASFDTTNFGLSIDPAEMFEKGQTSIMSEAVKNRLHEGGSAPLPKYLLSLRDPADETNDLGRKGLAIKHVQTTFKRLGYELQRDVKLNTRLSLLDNLIGTSYMLYRSRRMQLQQYGRQVAREKERMIAKKAMEIREGEKEEQANEEVVIDEQTQHGHEEGGRVLP